MEQNILIAVGVFSIICVICVATIGLSLVKQNEKLKERVSNEKKPMYNIWHRALSNNLQKIPDNQHGKETKGKKCPWDFEDIAKKMSFKLSDLKPTEKDAVLSIQKQFFDLERDALNGYINALKEKNKRQSTEFEEKEKKYVEKIRQLEKILVAEEIQVSVDGQVTNMKADKLKYEKFELNLEKSHLQKEVLSQKNRAESFNKYIVCNHDIDDDFEIKGVGYNAKITLEPKVNKKNKKSK